MRFTIDRATQGKCLSCRRFYYFRGALFARTCPGCGRQLERTSRESKLPRFVIDDANGHVAVPLDKWGLAGRPVSA